MTSSGPRRVARLLALTPAPVLAPALALAFLPLTAMPAAAQENDSANRPNALDGFSLSPRAITPQPTPTPAPTPPAPRLVLPSHTSGAQAEEPRAAPAHPAPERTPAARPVQRPAPTPTPAPSPVPTPEASPTPEPPATRLPDPESPLADRSEVGLDGMTIANGQAPAMVAPGTTAPEAGDAADGERGLAFWPLLVGTGLASLAIGVLLGRRTRRAPPPPGGTPQAEPVPPTPAARPAAPPVPDTPAQPAAPALPPIPPAPNFLEVEARPLRVGLNMLTATIEAEITVRNTGATPIGRVAVDLRLLSAHAGLDPQLVEIAHQPQGRPIVPPFALAPGESRTLRGVSALPREAIHVIDAAGRPMFVPILAAAAHTDWGVARCTYAVGLERADSPKLSPIWLDQPGKMYDQVAARPHKMKA